MRDNLARLGEGAPRSPRDNEILDQVYRDLGQIELQLSWLHRGQRSIDERLAKIEQSLFFRLLRWPGARYAHIRNLGARWLRRSDSQYREWVAYERRALLPGKDECLRRFSAFPRQPRITIVLRVSEPNLEALTASVESVTGQVYPCWELCICVDENPDSALLAYVDELVRAEGRIRAIRHAATAGTSGSLNAACSLANGEYIGFVQQGDVLSPYALFYVAEAVQDHAAALIYSDEDTLGADGQRTDPVFKPAWSPELLLATMYLSHFLVVSHEAFGVASGFRGVCDGAEYLDLCLRVTEAHERVTHIPRILYHARQRPSGAFVGSRSAVRKALNDAVHRRKWNAAVVVGASPDTFRVRHDTKRPTSIIICSRSPKLLRSVLKSVRSKTTYSAYEVIVAEHCPDGENPEMAAIAAEYDCTRVPVSGPFNFSGINNAASEYARGEILVFLNDDVDPLQAEWLSCIASGLEVDAVGIVGAKLLYPSGAIQHAGIVVGMGDGAGHVNRYKYRGDYWRWVDETRDVSAVTGACLGIRAELFRRLGGFDADFPNNYNDVDLCLRVREKGYRVVYEPGALLRHYEGQTRKLYVDYAEREKFYLRWHRVIEEGDPYYSPGLTTDDQEPTPNFRAVQPLPGAR